MYKLERYDRADSALLAAMEGQQAQVWTALPGIIQSFDAATMTCEVQPAVQGLVTDLATQEKNWVDLPLLLDCPVQFPAGGNCTLTFPVASGDECLVVFASRCIDSWFQSGGHLNQQAIMRMHDLSDGFAVLGFRSLPRVIPSISATDVQLRSDDGASFVGLNPTTHTVTITASDTVTITASAIHINGPVTINGNVETTGTLKNNNHDVGSTHKHSGVTTGAGNTGNPL